MYLLKCILIILCHNLIKTKEKKSKLRNGKVGHLETDAE